MGTRRRSVAVDTESGCPIRIRHLDDVIDNDDSEVQRKETETRLRYGDLEEREFSLVDKLLRGGIDTDELPCRQPKVVRMFVCSSGPDFEAERNYLYENVYSLVRQYCRNNYGLDFQLVDMLWGDPKSTQCDSSKMASVLKELRHCQDVSMGPNFVAFMGQKYGSACLPLEIASDEFEAIRRSLVEDNQDVDALDAYYKKDTNVKDNAYRLQEDRHLECKDEKDISDETIVELLQTRANKSLDKSKAAKFSCSDFEKQMQAGLLVLSKEERGHNCIVYTRDIKNIHQHLGAKNACNFVDVTESTDQWDEEKKSKIKDLRQNVENCLPESNILKLDIELNGCTLDDENAGKYVSNIGRHFFSTVTKMVDEQMSRRNKLCDDTLVYEVSRHWRRIPTMASPFTGREEVLNAIKGYLLTDTDQPLVLFGESGCGKSTIIAKAANDINEAITNADLSMPTAIIPRFLGETGQTEDVQPFLLHLTHQLAYVCGRYRQDIPTEYKALRNYFIDLIQRGEYGGMIVILLDSLDLLTTIDNGHKLDWLPPRIASNVKIIVTMNSENEPMLQRLGNKIDLGLIHLPEFQIADCENVFKLLMKICKRMVNYKQWSRVQTAFNACSSPLFAKIVYEEIPKWHSYDEPKDNELEHSLENIIRNIFERLEQKHGKLLVSKTLGYLTASKYGLTESELEDILSLDDELLNHIAVANNCYPSMRRFPPSLWVRLRHDLEPFLVQTEIDGVSVMTWAFDKFVQVASARYCEDENDETTNIYSNISDYYLGTWSKTKKKPFRHPSMLIAKYKLMSKEDESCRHVPEQPMSFGTFKHFNTRKMSQLPHVLMKCRRDDDLKSAVFCNFEWLQYKLKVFSIEKVIADFNLCDDREVSLVGDALRMSKSALSVNPKALGMELTGRLLPHQNTYPYIKDLIRQCDLHAQSSCPLVPNCQIYSAPGGPLQYECDVSNGVKCPIDIDVFTSPDGILLTAKPSYSSRLQVWELMYGEERPDIMLPVGLVKPTRNGKFMNIFVEKSIKIHRSDCGVLHGEVEIGSGKVADVDVSNKYMTFAIQKGTGPYVVDIERSEVIHKFTYHTHAVALSGNETYLAFNSERNILLFELPVMQRKCVATATDVPHDIIFINDSPKCFVLTKTKLIESITFDVINRKYKCKTVLTDLDARECIPSNTKKMLLVRCGKTIHVIDTYTDQVRSRFQKMPSGVFVDKGSTFSGAGFTPNDKMIVATRYTYLIVWDAETCEPVRVLQSSVSPITKLFTSDSVNKVVTVLENKTFQVWNLDNLDRDIHHSSEIHQGAVQSLAVSSASGYILSHDNVTPDAKLISLTTGEVIDTLQHSENTEDKICEVQLSPDGMYAVTRATIQQSVNSSSNTTFEVLTDDVLWEVETATKVFHAITNRYIVFSPTSTMAAFVTSAFYNRYDWSDNIYNVFIVNPESSSNYTIDFPFCTEFVSKPSVVGRDGDYFFLAVIQTCKKTFDSSNNKELSRWNEIRLYIQKLTTSQTPNDQSVLRLQNVIEEVGDQDQFLDIKSISDGNVLIVYAKNIESYDFETDKGIVTPVSVAKGAVLYDVVNGVALKHVAKFLDVSSNVSQLQISSKLTYIVDDCLRILKFHTDTMVGRLRSCKLLTGSARLALDGKYVVAISDNQRSIEVIRTSDDVQLGSVFVHGRAECLEIAADDRSVVVGCEDGRVMILSLILGFSDPLREYIEKMPSRCASSNDDNLVLNDVKHISHSTPDLQRLSARIRRKTIDEERRPPSYTTLQRAVTISRQSNRQRGNNTCIQQ